MIPEKLKMLISEIKDKEHTDEEWFALDHEVNEYLKALPERFQDYFIDTGAGEMLDMICSGIHYDRALKSYGVEIDDYDGRFLSWGELEAGETLEKDPVTGEYRRRIR